MQTTAHAMKLIKTQFEYQTKIDNLTFDHLAAVREMQAQIDALRAECREHRQMRVKEEKMWRTNTIENLMEATEEVLGEEP